MVFIERALEEHFTLYDETLRLHSQGLGYRRIAKILNLKPSTVGGWLYTGYNPRNLFNIADTAPNPHLAYIAGVILGDGALTEYRVKGRKKKQHMIQLKAKDLDFVEKFASEIGKVFGKQPPRIWKTSEGLYTTHIQSRHLYEFLCEKINIENLAEAFPIEFIQGLADSDGCLNLKKGVPYIRIINTNKGLLEFVRKLLRNRLNIDCCLHFNAKVQRGKGTKPVYELVIDKPSEINKFREKIKFSIRRRQSRLEEWGKTR